MCRGTGRALAETSCADGWRTRGQASHEHPRQEHASSNTDHTASSAGSPAVSIRTGRCRVALCPRPERPATDVGAGYPRSPTPLAFPPPAPISSNRSSALNRSPFRTAFAATRARRAALLHLLHPRRARMCVTDPDSRFSVGTTAVSLGFVRFRASSNPAGVAFHFR